MKILLSPTRSEVSLLAIVVGDAITVNGESIDFSGLPEGAILPHYAVDSMWISGDVSRVNGEICLSLLLPHGANAPEETRYPEAYTVPLTVISGQVPLPPYDSPPVVDDVQLPEPEPEVTP